MEWTEISDPSGDVDFLMEWTLVSSEYAPEEIQALINDEGVRGMVHTVNEHFKLNKHGQAVMFMGRVGNRKVVVQA